MAKVPALRRELEIPKRVFQDIQGQRNESLNLVPRTGRGSLLNTILHTYIEHQMATDKVLTGILRDVLSEELPKRWKSKL